MNRTIRRTTFLVFAAAVLLPAGAAQAQWYSSVSRQPPPLYPYAVQTDRPYAVEVAPNTYIIQRPAAPRRQTHRRAAREATSIPAPAVPMPAARERRRSKVDPALIEELRKRPRVERPKVASIEPEPDKMERSVINTTRIVREPPIVIETERVVDDPPRVIERHHYVEDEPAPAGKRNNKRNNKNTGDGKRIIEADAQITILGPDRMTIQLYRKGDSPKAQAQAN